MSVLMKGKKAIYVVFAAGIISLATYGICHTALAMNDHEQSQNNGEVIISGMPADDGCPVTGGTQCNPGGCAGCNGCIKASCRQEIAVLPGDVIQDEQTY